MKKHAIALILILMSIYSSAQVTNNAIDFERNGRISLGVIRNCTTTSGTTLQLWFNPQHWIPGANIATWGQSLSIQLGAPGKLVVKSNNEEFTFSDTNISAGNWTHITLLLDGSNISLITNNANEQTHTLAIPFTVPEEEPLLLGGGFLGRMDEVRIWNFILPADYNRFWNNTIDKFNPSWKYLAAYWKFDQTRLDKNVYDYSENGNNGTFSTAGIKRSPVTDNPKFVYRRNLAYSDCSRFFDRGVQHGQYLKSNVISMIGATAQADGTLKYKQPDNSGIITNGSYLAEYDNRTGILDLNGDGAQMNVGKESLIAFNNSTYLESTSAYTFMTWISIDTWKPGAFLIKKESSPNNGISLRMGDTLGDFILRCNGVELTYSTKIQVEKWHHIGFSTNGQTVGNEFIFVLDENTITPSFTHTTVINTTLSKLQTIDCIIGEGVDGKLDETITWSQKFDATNIIAQGKVLLEPGIGKTITGAYSRSVDGLWKYDYPEALGRDSYSTPEWFRMIKSTFEGYEGAHVTISIDKWSDDFFNKINNNAQYRETLAESISAIGNESFIDGVDYDFEWNNNWSGIGTLCQLVRNKLQTGKIQAVSPHELYYNFPTDKMQYVDYFNFQDYGPGNRNIFNFDNYRNFFTKAKNHGYPVDKIMLSYATTTSGAMYSNGSRPGSSHAEYYPTGWRSMPYNTFEYSQNSYDVGDGLTRYFTGMEQVWLRSEFMNNNSCAGIFYWDMGNDTPNCDDPRSLATFASFAINSNIQKIIEKVDIAAEIPEEYEYEESLTEYYRIRGAAEGHTTHYLYQNGDELFAGEKGGDVSSIFCFEESTNDDSYYLKANDGRYIQDRSKLETTKSIYRFGKDPVSYSFKSSEYDYPNDQYCLEQTYYTPNKTGFTDVQRCLKCNGNNEGVTTWGPWTAASHWHIEPIYGYDIYKVSITDIEAISYLAADYTGSHIIYNGGFIAIQAGEEIVPENIASTQAEQISIDVDKDGKRIVVSVGVVSEVEGIKGQGLPSTIHDLAGRKLQKIQTQGIYIVNGKKHLYK
ncbi:MAG: hypothetical protein IKY71_02415 [Bacteroidaceae bacterium]|nr:hypothetical protein [Bacteroidaceae bacterium]